MGRHTRPRRIETILRRASIPVVTVGFLVPLGGTSLADATPVAPGPDTSNQAAPAPAAPAPGSPTPGSPGQASPGQVSPAPASPAQASTAPSGETATSSPTPCAKTVKACAQLSSNEAWITDGAGNVLRGPIRITHGGRGQETPVGSFHVTRKDATHVSQEQAGVKMPFSVFFDNQGRAFHGGSLARQSAGCVHLSDGDAKFFFEHLAVGDSVQIVK